MKPRINLISLAVSDLGAATAFYRDGLGFVQLPTPPSVTFFKMNGSWLGLSERHALAHDAGVTAEGSGFRGVTLSHNVASEDEVAPLFEAALRAGATLVKPVQRADWGGWHGYFADLDGHLWEIAHNPFGWLGPNDD